MGSVSLAGCTALTERVAARGRFVLEEPVGGVGGDAVAVRPSGRGWTRREAMLLVSPRNRVPAEVGGTVVGDRVDDDAPAGELPGDTTPVAHRTDRAGDGSWLPVWWRSLTEPRKPLRAGQSAGPGSAPSIATNSATGGTASSASVMMSSRRESFSRAYATMAP